MARTVGGVEIGTLTLDADSKLPLYKQLYVRLRELIVEGTLKGGARLPSNRTLAAELCLSRNTVVRAVARLVKEGYLSTRLGDGTYVAPKLPENKVVPLVSPGSNGGNAKPPLHAPSQPHQLAGPVIDCDAAQARPFALGVPALDAFPAASWLRHWLRRSRQIEESDLCCGSVVGDERLRQVVASHLAMARGLRCSADQVVIVESSLDAIDTITRALVRPGDPVWLEEPGDLRVRASFRSAGARITPVPVDADGMDPEAGAALAPMVRCIHTTPSHQFPVGATMSVQRRKALLDWASKVGAWIIEDDLDSEFRFAGRPLPALQGLDRLERVIYIGTFAKAMYPSLRLGFMVVPKSLVEAVATTRTLIDRRASVLSQRVLADFIETGEFSRHLRKMRLLYQRRHEALAGALKAASHGTLRPCSDNMGIHSVVFLPDADAEAGIVEASARHHMDVRPLSPHYLGSTKRYGVLLGYGCVSEDEIRKGVEALAPDLEQLSRSSGGHRRPNASEFEIRPVREHTVAGGLG